ncbi:MAG TPA: hypothetical protein VNE40_03685 [Candidatus Dormibacteraeota bacterium]|nr:hypothetical protein [Candidatus Dormibacteraeota bacterium]
MRKFLESPREKAERFIKDFNSNPSKVHTYSYAGSEFRDWLKGSLENRYSDYAGLDDISDYELAMIYEFSEATRTEVLEKINNLIYLLMFVAWSLVVGFILR